MAKIFNGGTHFFRMDKILYMAKDGDKTIRYNLEGAGVQEYKLKCESTEQRDSVYEYIKNEIINN